jgi:hypothetical protein
MKVERTIVVFVGGSEVEAVEALSIERVLGRLPEDAVVVTLGSAGLAGVAGRLAVERGLHVGVMSGGPRGAAGMAARQDAVARLRPATVFAGRRSGAETSRMVALARAVGAEVRPIGPGHGAAWDGVEFAAAEVAEVRRRTAGVPVVGVSGSRKWSDLRSVEKAVRGFPTGALVVEGDARGLDRYAAAFARLLGHPVLSVAALWDFFGERGKRGNPAGYRRNEAMLALELDRLVAFPLDGAGTAQMMEAAEVASVPVERVRSGLGFQGRLARVVHCQEEDYDHYIGRGRDPKTEEMGEWGNRFSHRPSRVPGVVEVGTAEEAVVLFRWELLERIRSGDVDRSALAALHGTTLGCWCGTGRPCHGLPLGHAAAWAYFGEES